MFNRNKIYSYRSKILNIYERVGKGERINLACARAYITHTQNTKQQMYLKVEATVMKLKYHYTSEV